VGKKHKKEQAMQTAWSVSSVHWARRSTCPTMIQMTQDPSRANPRLTSRFRPTEAHRRATRADVCRGQACPAHRPPGHGRGGKDSTIRHVMTGFNPQGCHVASFGVPTKLELAHDFLWRIHPHAPQRGL